MDRDHINQVKGEMYNQELSDNGTYNSQNEIYSTDNFDSQNESENTENKSKKSNKNQSIPDDDYRLLQTYFKDVGTESLLSPAQEIQISTKLKKYKANADKLQDILDSIEKSKDRATTIKREQVCKCNVEERKQKISKRKILNSLSKERTERLAALQRAYSNHEKFYKSKFIRSNLRLVISIAKNYIGRGLPWPTSFKRAT